MGFKKQLEVTTNVYMSYLSNYIIDCITNYLNRVVRKTIYNETKILLYPKAVNYCL